MTVMPPNMSVAKRPMSTQLCGSVTVVTFPVCGRSLQDAKVLAPPIAGAGGLGLFGELGGAGEERCAG